MKSKNIKSSQAAQGTQEHPNSKIGMLIIVLIILQSYLVPLISIASGTDYSKYTNYLYFHTLCSYTIIVLSIMIFHENGLVVFQDHFSLWIIVLTCFFRASIGGDNEVIFKFFLVLLGLLLSHHIIRNRRSIKTPSLKSFIIGALWSVGTVVAAALLRVFLDPNHGTLPSNLPAYIINFSVFNLSFGTVIEEAYFRGLLFGFLVMNGYKENTALFLQAVLFWGIHYLKIADPILFFAVIPLLTLSLTLIIKKYKMLYLSIMLHTINNVFGGILVALLGAVL
jgi:membrane protease YdiL (CAAX protease family)